MTQVKYRAMGGKGMTQAAWKYAMQRENAFESHRKSKANKDAIMEEERKKITLPTLKWMQGK